jgi:predicted dehydrogenase
MKSPVANQTRREFITKTSVAAVAVASSSVLVAGAETDRSLKAAVIGHTGRGDYGHGLENIFANRKDLELVAVVDPDGAGRKRTAAKIGAPRSYADYCEMLKTERPQLVSVAMRHADEHHDIILECLRAGAHVYSEKPFVTAPNEADELLATAERAHLKIAVAHTMRMMPIMARLRQGVREGLIGDLVQMRAHGKQDPRAGGEDMMVLGSHLFDLMRMFAGDPLSCSARVLQNGRDITRDDRRLVKDNVGYVAGDEVFAQFAFANGVQAMFTSAAKLRETLGPWGIELLGSKGAVRINCDISPNVFTRRSTDWSAKGKTDTWEPLDPALIQAPPEHNLGPVGDWLDAVAKNREPECSGRNGAWAVEMVCAVYECALKKSQVTFPLARRTHPLA